MTAPISNATQPALGSTGNTRRQGKSNRRTFGPDFEAAYIQARLVSQRTLIRAACTLGALFAVLRGAEVWFGEHWGPARLAALFIVVVASVLLAALAWSRLFERWYLPTARIVVPARNLIGALALTVAAANGSEEMLMFLPLMIVGPHFFLGVSPRTALVSALLCLLGFLAAASTFGLELQTAIHVSALLAFGTAASAVAAQAQDRLARTSYLETHRMSELAEHDPLTGLKNRRIFDDSLHALWGSAVAKKMKLAIVIIDIDHFKDYNDRYGHQAGDRALRRVAQMLQSFVERPSDVLARYGGEEFAAILHDVDVQTVEKLAERMRRAVEADGTRKSESRRDAPVTISIGVAIVDPAQEREPRGVVQLADQALYEAKLRGRNRVVLKDQSAYELLETGVFARIPFAGET